MSLRMLAVPGMLLSRFSLTNLEALTMVWALHNFHDIIYVYQLTIYIEHAVLLHLFKGKNPSGLLARWFVRLDEFRYLLGKANVTADALMKCCSCFCVRNY